ncbi:unnamed protein product [Brassicogethes aeneus]|uniref:Protein kinase C-binding protein 1 n=1 Tax=Brassicogethes aeneus TaxID=1431903 RepID=A0A9P0FHT3_BRAAE|nr:unnamed protein product [Brassicogethes aeneus]
MSEVNSVNMEEEKEAPSEVVEQPEPKPLEPTEDVAEETPTPSVTSEVESVCTEPPFSNNTSVIDTDTSEETKDDEQNKRSKRELKLLLALSKEANLNTNISHKRKSLENTKYKDNYVIKLGEGGEKAKKTPKQSPEGRVIRYPVTAETELEEAEVEPKEETKVEKDPPVKIIKRKKESVTEAVTGGATEEISKKSRKSSSSELIMFKPDKDKFCWRCHRDNVNIACETCPRAYHQKCLKQTINDPEHWPCPECVEILRAESTQTRSEAMKGMDLEHLCSLLKHAVKRMIQCSGAEPFIHAVNEKDFPDYKRYIIQPMDLTLLDKNIKQNLYGSTQAFEADAKWILHNSIIYNSSFLDQSKLTSVAKSIVKICKQEMAEIENCPSCYLNANTKKDWFVQVCPKPHLLLWAKLKGFPYWPAKLMCSNNSGMVDVRFFGAHDKAWVSYKDCYLYSLKDPNSYKQKRYDIDQCTKELDVYVRNLRRVFGEVRLATFKALLVPENEAEHLQELLPKYNVNTNYKTLIRQIYDEGSSQNSSMEEDLETANKNNDHDESGLSKSPGVDSTMEGYGTDDESKTETTRRRGITKMISDDTMDSEDIDDAEKVEEEEESSGNNSPTVMRGKLKVLPRRSSDMVRKYSTDTESSSSSKLKRRNSEISTKPVDPEKLVETSSNEDKIDKDSVVVKPVEILVDNAEISISPKSKLLITDKLMKKLSDSDLEKLNADDGSSKKQDEAMEVSSTSEKVEVEAEDTSKKMDVDDEKEAKDAENKSTEEKRTANESSAKVVSEDVQNIIEEFDEEDDDADSSFDDLPLAQAVKKASEEVTFTRIIPREIEVKEVDAPKKPAVEKNVESNNRKTDEISNSLEITRKRKKSNDDTASHNKMVKLVSIDKILGKKITSTPVKSNVEEVVIKSEPESSESDSEYMEKKRSKPHEIRTRSKTEEKANKLKVADSNKKAPPPTNQAQKKEDVGEISVKSFAKLTPSAKPKSRRSLPIVSRFSSPAKEALLKKQPPPLTELSRPNADKKNQQGKSGGGVVSVTNSVSLIKSTKTTVQNSPSAHKAQAITTTPKTSTSFEALRPGLVFLAPTSEVMLLPTSSALTYTNTANPILSLIPPPLTASNPLVQPRPLVQAVQPAANTNNGKPPQKETTVPSQNFIPQCETMEQDAPASQPPQANALLSTLLDKRSQIEVSRAEIGADRGAAQPPDARLIEPPSGDANLLNGFSPQTLSRAVTDLMSRPPPKLRPRPPGALSCVFEEGNPSSAGPVTAKINSIAHRLGDYFRGMLIETLDNLGQSNNQEATITSLKLEIESLKHKHEVEISEVKKNVSTVLEDIQRSIIEERDKVISETRAACEAETIKRLEETKSKQWCANCSEVAQFYCCWNTSYCDYPCQQKHWSKHINNCTQSFNQPSTAAVGLRQPNQPIVLRPTNPPANKQNVGRIITSKPTKVYMNRVGGNPKAMQAFKVLHLQ